MRRSGRSLEVLVVCAAFTGACRYDNPPVTREIQWDSPRTEALARAACYDCHSNETDWKWYHHLPIAGSVVTHDVHAARCHMNFSEWDAPNGDAREAPDEIREGRMPLSAYKSFHKGSRLTDAEFEELAQGFERTLAADPPVRGDACVDGTTPASSRSAPVDPGPVATAHDDPALRRAWAAVAAAARTAPGASPLPDRAWQLDADRGDLVLVVGDGRTVAAGTWSGRVALDGAGGCDVTIEAPVAGLTSTDADARDTLVGLIGRAPTVTFAATSCAASADGVIVHGDLDVAGARRALDVPLAVRVDDGRLTARGAADVDPVALGLGRDLGERWTLQVDVTGER